MATRFSATAAAIGLVVGVLGASSAGAADAAARPAAPVPAASAALAGAGGPGSVPFSVADPDTAPRPVPTAPAAAAALPPTKPTTPTKPKNHHAKLPFHQTGKKARSLPDTGVPMSAALGAVTALTALLAGIGTVLAARRRTDHEA